MNHPSLIEPLEDRIAPALILNPYTVTYQDASGDTAVVKISKPLFKNATVAGKILLFVDSNDNLITETFTNNNTPESLGEINLVGRTGAQGLNISVKVIPQVGVGSGTVDVGNIDAANFLSYDQVTGGIDLGSVYVQGNLGVITAGDDFSTPAIHSLTVGSMTEAAQSSVLGPIVSMDVKGDFNANLEVIGYRYGSISKLVIGGSLAGDAAGDNGTGQIVVTGRIASATIGNITGGAGSGSGELLGAPDYPVSIGILRVLGSITGGAGQDSGRVAASTAIRSITIGGSIIGGSGQDSGEIAGPMGSVTIGGGLTGGSGISSGTLLSEGTNIAGNLVPTPIGHVYIGGDVTGGNAGVAATSSAAATPGDSGIISALSAKSITIAGSLIGGTAGTGTNTDGTLDETADTSGAILVNSVGTLTIGGKITGGTGPDSGVVTSVPGASLTATMKYGSIVVHGDVAGGSGAVSGSILVDTLFGGSVSNLHIGGNLTGSSGAQSGEVEVNNALTTLYVGGNVTGGGASDTGEILAGATVKTAIINGNLAGGAVDSSAAVVGSGYLQAGQFGSVTIDGSVTSGSNSGSGGIANSGAIRSATNINSLTIVGEVTGTRADPVYISATRGPSTSAHSKTDLAIGSASIDGAATWLDLLAGYSPTVSTSGNAVGAPLGTPTDGSAQMGAIVFGSTLSASNIVAGAKPDSNGFFGTSGNTAITTGLGDLHSSIASIVVTGQATGDSTPSDSFGFVAENLGPVQVDGSAITEDLTPGDPKSVNGTNLYLLEIPPPA